MINFLYGTNTLSAYLIPYKSGLDKAKPITLVLIISDLIHQVVKKCAGQCFQKW